MSFSGGASFLVGLSCTGAGVVVGEGRERVGESILTGSSSSSIKWETGGGPISGD